MNTNQSFYRGSVDVRMASHVVIVTTRNGSQLLRRVSLNAAQMAQVENALMLLQHNGDIQTYLIAAAEDLSFAGLLGWVDGFKVTGEQGQLLNVQQNTLFSGGAQ